MLIAILIALAACAFIFWKWWNSNHGPKPPEALPGSGPNNGPKSKPKISDWTPGDHR